MINNETKGSECGVKNEYLYKYTTSKMKKEKNNKTKPKKHTIDSKSDQ